MKPQPSMTMRDAFIQAVYNRMATNDKIFFLCADFGSPKLDDLRRDYGNRFINVGIAEQNLINVSTGLALEGFTVYAYAIAPFLTMRAYEQIRVNLSILGQLKSLNINLVGVGAGVSYDVSGPSHHCLEDLAIMRLLPHIEVFSPADWRTAEALADYSVRESKPKYFRLDGKPLPAIYNEDLSPDLSEGFTVLSAPSDICLIGTGYMTHQALKVAAQMAARGKPVGVIDVFRLKPFNALAFTRSICRCRRIVTLEEAFIGNGGLDCAVAGALAEQRLNPEIVKIGFNDKYSFDVGTRDYLHAQAGMGEEAILKAILATGAS